MGQSVQRSLRDSELLLALAGGTRLTLTACRRSDSFLFGWYSSLADEPRGARFGLPLEQQVAEARRDFHEPAGFVPPRIS